MRLALLSMVVIGLALPIGRPAARPSPPLEASPAQRWAEQPHQTKLARADNGHFYAYGHVNGMEVHFVVDTGATDVVLTMDDARRAKIAFDPTRFTVVATGASGDVYGQVVPLNEVELDGKRVRQISGVVVRGLTISLLGQRYLREQPHVGIDGDTMTIG